VGGWVRGWDKNLYALIRDLEKVENGKWKMEKKDAKNKLLNCYDPKFTRHN
jgi:hypothetical protein